MNKSHLKSIQGLFAITLLLGSCSQKEANKNSDTVDKAQAFVLIEQRQRVIRYNCQDQVISDKIESVKPPIEHLSIHPQSSVQIYSSTFENVTIHTVPGVIVNYTDFTIDLNPGAFNLEVQVGINQIDYKFYYCSQLMPAPNEGKCAQMPELRESGSLFINVSYENIELPGESIVKPSLEQCKPTPVTRD